MKVWEKLLLFVVLVAGCACMQIDLQKLLAGRHHKPQITSHKRNEGDFNPCNLKEKPFPCKSTDTCISVEFICDDNFDCEDGSDEDPELCTAAVRPPVDDMVNFISREKSWILPEMLGNKPIDVIVHNLAVSRTIDEFRRRVGLNRQQFDNLKAAMKGIRDKDETALLTIGMPESAWDEVKFMFDRLLKSGFY